MESKIIIREAVTEHEIAQFWQQLSAYFARDIFSNPESEDRDYFLGLEYRQTIEKLHSRQENPIHWLFLKQNGIDIGFAQAVIYAMEDGKCFIMEFCIYPEYRGNGTGTRCAKAVLRWAKEHGALFAELNTDGDPRRRNFWNRIGFEDSGKDEWGVPLMCMSAAHFSILNSVLKPLTESTAGQIADWEYESPYHAYSFKGHHDDYLLDESIWGTEQFCLMDGDAVIAQVACQFESDDLWVGWSLAPELTGKGNGGVFVRKCVEEIRRIKQPTGRILLRVAAWNQRAIKAYQKAGFTYLETIQDEIAYSDKQEDFWVMTIQ
ncbi:MAG: GNAT family N-acetyltransferase [Faecousia sp.]